MNMFRNKKLFIVFALLSITLLLVQLPVTKTSAQEERDWMTNDEFLEKMNQIVEDSSGKVEFDVAGYSSQGTEIMYARVGDGDQVILINSSIHGNEKSGGEALVSMFEYLGTSEDEFAQNILDNVTIVAVPRFNVDGLELTTRQNVYPWDEVVADNPHLEGASRAWYYNNSRQGFDINRDFNADLDYEVTAEDLPGNTLLPGFFITSEAKLLRDLYKDLQAEFGEVEAFVDLHHMGTPKLNKSGEDVTIALDYPPLGNDPDKYADWPLLDQEKSKRYALAAALGVEEFSDKDEPGVSQYIHFEERDYPGQARSAFALNGSATVLFEMPGQQPRYGYDQELVDRVENGLWGIISRMADGTIDDLNGDDFLTEVPRYWTDNTTDMRDVLERFTNEGQFENESDARLLDNQLALLQKYEEQEDSSKMVKHLNGFKVAIDDLNDKGLIKNEAYSRLNSDAEMLIERWEKRVDK